MEVKEADRIVIAKPVATRPSCSTFKSFSELLAGAINASPPDLCSDSAAASAIRPKTVRVKPVVNRGSVGVVSSQADLPGTPNCSSSDNVSNSDVKSTVVYKPLAKLVSRTAVSLLSNMGNFNGTHRQAIAQVEARAQQPNRPQISPNGHQSIPSFREMDHATESSKIDSQNMEEDQKHLPSTTSADRPSYDGYNWRKYGQKQVKGSEYPRSYYKCTYPNCPVKKKVERSLDGQITEIVYKGEHNHSKPQPPKRNLTGTNGLCQDTSNPLWSNNNNINNNNHLISEKNESSEVREENHQNEVGLTTKFVLPNKGPLSYDPVNSGGFNNEGGTPENSCGISGDCEEGSKGTEVGDDESRSKRRKIETQSSEASVLGDGVQEPRIVLQNSTDSDILGDGFRWRKYGQKVVKGNAYPRSYYRCTSLKCNVRKHVERASDDPRAFITTYEGRHNHEMPIKNTNQAASEREAKQ